MNDQVTIDPVTTAPGVLNDQGLVKVGTRLKDLPVSLFSEAWMKVVTKKDQQAVQAYKTRKEAEKKAKDKPTAQDALEASETLREQLRSLNGKVSAMQKKLDAQQDEISALNARIQTVPDQAAVAASQPPKSEKDTESPEGAAAAEEVATPDE